MAYSKFNITATLLDINNKVIKVYDKEVLFTGSYTYDYDTDTKKQCSITLHNVSEIPKDTEYVVIDVIITNPVKGNRKIRFGKFIINNVEYEFYEKYVECQLELDSILKIYDNIIDTSIFTLAYDIGLGTTKQPWPCYSLGYDIIRYKWEEFIDAIMDMGEVQNAEKKIYPSFWQYNNRLDVSDIYSNQDYSFFQNVKLPLIKYSGGIIPPYVSIPRGKDDLTTVNKSRTKLALLKLACDWNGKYIWLEDTDTSSFSSEYINIDVHKYKFDHDNTVFSHKNDTILSTIKSKGFYQDNYNVFVYSISDDKTRWIHKFDKETMKNKYRRWTGDKILIFPLVNKEEYKKHNPKSYFHEHVTEDSEDASDTPSAISRHFIDSCYNPCLAEIERLMEKGIVNNKREFEFDVPFNPNMVGGSMCTVETSVKSFKCFIRQIDISLEPGLKTHIVCRER